MKILPLLLIILIATTAHAASDDYLKQQAQNAITQAQNQINQMQQNNLPTKNANYALSQAKQTLTDTNLLIQTQTNSTNLTAKQIESLKGKDQTQLTYQNVITQANKVTQIKQSIEYTQYTINQIKTRSVEYEKQQVNTTDAQEQITLAEQSFKNEQIDQAIIHATRAAEELEVHKTEIIIQKTLIESSKNYVEKNAAQLTIIAITLTLIALLIYNYNKKTRQKQKIEKLSDKQTALSQLIIQTQKERYLTGEINKKTYDSQIKKYETTLDKVKNELKTIKIN